MNKKEKALPLPLPLSPSSLSLSLSFFLLFSLSSSLSLSNAGVLHTLSHTNAPAFTRHHRSQRQEGERNLHRTEMKVNIQEEKRKCAKLSLSLSFTHPHLPSLLHILSLSSFHVRIHRHRHYGTRLSEGEMSMSQHPYS